MRFTSSAIYLSGIILSTVILGMSFSAQAQTPTPSPTPAASATPSLEHEFLKNVLRDQKAIWTSPFHLEGEDAKWLAPLGMGTGALIATDRDTGDEMLESHHLDNASRIVSYAGSIYGVAAEAGGFYLIGRATHDYRARETGVLSAEAALDSGIVVTVLKEVTQRARPTAGVDRSKFFVGGSSFPSGHSIQAWSIATVVANEYHDHPAVEIAAYGIASAVSVARFTGHYHYLSDVLVGSAMGFGIGRYVYRTHHRIASKGGGDEDEEEELIERARRWPAFAPVFDTHTHSYGLGLAWSF